VLLNGPGRGDKNFRLGINYKEWSRMSIALKDVLKEKKSEISAKWFDAIIETYPADNSGFLKKQKDRFLNPVGYTFTQGIDSLLDELIDGEDIKDTASLLNDLIKVRAVQNFSPSKAMGFIFSLKKVIREELNKEIRQNQINEELLGFESRIDDLALFAFDIYAKCRDQLSDLKTDELKRMTFSLLKKANLMSEIPAQEFEHKDLNLNI
jgi:hypothetical protein